jgi:hypothetical protein
MDKKAGANIWWIIIGAVMALVVLIIVLVIFTGRSSTLNEGLGDCRSKGGVCMNLGSNCPSGTIGANTFSCGETANCCIGTPKKFSEHQGSSGCTVGLSDVDGNSWCG